MATVKKNKIIWDSTDWLSGLHPQYDAGTNAILFSGLEDSLSFNPFRRLGYAMPGKVPSDVTSASEVAAVLENIIYVDGDKSYTVGGDSLYQFDEFNQEITSDDDFPHAVSGATMSDVIQYKIGTTNYVFYSWYDGTDGDVGRLLTSGPTFDDEFMSTTPANEAVLEKDVAHPMIVGDDDMLYIGNGNNLVRFDGQTGTDGTLSSPLAKLTLPSQYEIKSFSKLSNRTLVIFASTNETQTNYDGSVKAYFWDYISANPYAIYDIFGSKAGGAFEYKNTIGIFTKGISPDPGTSTRNVHLSLYDGSRFERNFSFKGGLPAKGGVEVVGDTIYANNSGTVLMIDNPFPGVTSGPHQIAKGGGTSNGLLRTIKTGERLISSGTTTNGGLEVLSTDYAEGTAETTFVSPVFNEGKKGQVTKIRIEFDKAVTGGREFSAYLYNRDGTDVGKYTGIGTVTADKTILEKNITPSDNFDALQLKLEWATGDGATEAPVVKRVVVDYKEVNQLI